jgi:hypothetical protein
MLGLFGIVGGAALEVRRSLRRRGDNSEGQAAELKKAIEVGPPPRRVQGRGARGAAAGGSNAGAPPQQRRLGAPGPTAAPPRCGQPPGPATRRPRARPPPAPPSQQYAKDLERERRAAKAAARRVSGLEAEAAALRRDTEAAAQRNAELLAQQLTLEETTEKLRSEANELALANQRLTEQVRRRPPSASRCGRGDLPIPIQLSCCSPPLPRAQMEQLSAAHNADVSRFEADLAALRDRVASILQRMFSNEIDEEAAVEALHELGCEVRFVANANRRAASRAGSEVSYTFEPRLVLDDPLRMARLMAAARGSQGSSLSPRLLEGGQGQGSPGKAAGSLAPRIAQSAGGVLPPIQAALTIGSAPGSSSGGSGPGTPRFTLSWLAPPAADAARGSGTEVTAATAPAAPAAAKDAVRRSSTAKDSAPAAPRQASASKPAAKAPRTVAQVEQEGGNLVFSHNDNVRGGRGAARVRGGQGWRGPGVCQRRGRGVHVSCC